MTKLYLDMDGVITKFFEKLASDNGVTKWTDIQDVPMALNNIKGTDFFHRLDEYETTTDLLSFVQWYDWGICSSPLTGDEYNSAYHKRRWLEDKGYMPKIQNLIFTHNKEQFATNRLDGSPNLLIDDKPTNCKKWRDQDGIAIRYQANEDSLDELIDRIYKIMENWK